MNILSNSRIKKNVVKPEDITSTREILGAKMCLSALSDTKRGADSRWQPLERPDGVSCRHRLAAVALDDFFGRSKVSYLCKLKSGSLQKGCIIAMDIGDIGH